MRDNQATLYPDHSILKIAQNGGFSDPACALRCPGAGSKLLYRHQTSSLTTVRLDLYLDFHFGCLRMASLG
jgi:hypothetical protein